MTNRTPSPWKVFKEIRGNFFDGNSFGYRIETGQGDYIALLGNKEANAQFIVIACNSHDELVKALKIAEEELCKTINFEENDPSTMSAVKAVREALLKAVWIP